MPLPVHSTHAETAFRGFRIIGSPANMFAGRRLINIASQRNSSITLQEVAPLAPICNDTRNMLTFIASKYEVEMVGFKKKMVSL